MRLPLRTLFGVLLASVLAQAGIITTDFEAFADGTALTNQAGGITFSNARVWSAGLSLNELEFPPKSGSNVAVDSGGPMSILFTTPVLNFSAFFTYSTGITLTAFDSSDLVVGIANSAFSQNVVSSGNSPNEFLEVSFAGGIKRVSIAGAIGGTSFTADDLSASTPDSIGGGLPEPVPGVLVGVGLALLGLCARSRRYRL